MGRALVTGGASGIGAAIASRLVSSGLEVVVADCDGPAAEQFGATIGASAVELDVADSAAVAAAVGATGPFDVLVNNAGVDDGRFFTDIDPAGWRRLIAVNFEGVLACTHAVLPAMYAAGYGRIVNISSEAGRIGAKGNAVYAATKGALIAFTKSLAREGARFGVTVNAVAPGPIDTPLLRAMDPRTIERITATTQLRRLGTPDEVAACVAFLVSADAAYITGETIAVSGGMGIGG